MERIIAPFKAADLRFKVAYALGLAWIAINVVSIPLIGYLKIDGYWAVAFVFRLAVVAVAVRYVKGFFIDGKRELYAGLRKVAGYAFMLCYLVYNMPHVAWEYEGLLAPADSFWFWLDAALSALVPAALFFALFTKRAQVYWGHITAEEARDKKLLAANRKGRKRRPLVVVGENVDFFIQTIFMVLVILHFVFQLYEIPTPSMVPTLLVKDRPLVVKALDAPAIPMSPLRLPRIAPIERGNIVVFESLDYERPPLIEEMLNQFLFYLTFSAVNREATVVHFVVKRVVGLPGEELMMVDDQLYVRKAGEKDFAPVAEEKAWVHLDKDARLYNAEASAYVDELLAKGEPAALGRDLQALAARIRALAARTGAAERAALVRGASERHAMTVDQEMGADPELFKYRSIGSNGNQAFQVAWNVAAFPRELADLEAYLLSCEALPAPANLYEAKVRALNLLAKRSLAQKVARVLELAVERAAPERFGGDQIFQELEDLDYKLGSYLSDFDRRNFPAYRVPAGQYFLMGDNRYNSLDFRFSRMPRSQALDAPDPYSVLWSSTLELHALDEARILGRVALRVFPFDRLGPVRP